MKATDVLGPDGPVAKRLARFEDRPEQTRMAEAVEEALAEGRHLLVEAGTGVGTSFAYLVPAILRAARHPEKVVVATHTIALQEQLLRKDLPFLSGILPAEFSVVLAKGRSNYLCWRRLVAAVNEDQALFDLKADVDELHRIRRWAETTEEGTLQDLDFRPRPEVWSRVNAEAGACSGRRCDYQGKCPFQIARRRLQNANVIIANHSLVFSDLGLRQEGANILPDYDILILDEAHEVEGVAGDHLGIRLSSGGVRYLLSTLVGRGGKGLLAAAESGDLVRSAVDRARTESERFFAAIAEWAATRAPKNLRVDRPEIVEEGLSEEMARLSRLLDDEAHALEEEGRKAEIAPDLAARAAQCSAIAQSVRAFLDRSLKDQVYWVDMEEDGRKVDLRSAPVRVGPLLSELLFDEVRSIVMTSATLTIGRERSFAYFRDRLGLVDAAELALGSPFDYATQARIYLPRRMPDPRSGDGFETAVADEIVRAVVRSEGRAFVLFTSYRMLDRVYERTRGEIEGRGFRVLRQGGGLPRGKLLSVFREDVSSVLFGTDSFWQGVDVPGEALSHVVITKLPFDVPDRPVVEARSQEIDARGGNAFMEYSLPRAVLKLKQGFGRLIRTRDDRGAVTILDPRVVTKRYGRLFLESLPECEVVRD